MLIRMAVVILAACLLLSLPTAVDAAGLISACEKNKEALWTLSFEGDTAKIASAPKGAENEAGSFPFEKVRLNDDQAEDIHLDMQGCGTGGCMNAWFAGCGDGNHFLAAFAPNYGDPSPDPAHFRIVDGTKWYDLTLTEIYSNDGENGPLQLGWRLRFDGKGYTRSFLPKEYASLMRQAKKGKEFALYQLADQAYPRLAEFPEDPDLVAVKADLLKPALVKKSLAVEGARLSDFPEEVRKNRDYVLVALKHESYYKLRDLEPAFLRDPVLAETAVRKNGNSLQYFSPEIRGNLRLVELAVRQNAGALEYASESIRANRALLLDWSKKYKISANDIAEPLRRDLELAKVFVANDYNSYNFFDESLRKNRALTLSAVAVHGSGVWRSVPEPLQRDPEIFLAAAKGDGTVTEHLPDSLRNDHKFLARLLCANQDIFDHLPPENRADRDFARIAAIRYPAEYGKAPKSLQEDKQFALEVVSADPDAYTELPESLRADKEIARTVFRQTASPAWKAPQSISQDPEIIALLNSAPKESPSIAGQKKEVARLCARLLAQMHHE
jgi:Domain of unknown function (DUF4116)